MSIKNAITLVGGGYNTPFDTITSDDQSYSLAFYKGEEHLATAHLSKVDQVINGVTTATIVQEIDLINIPLKTSNIQDEVRDAADKGQGLIDYGTTTIRGLNAKGLDINAITVPLNFDENETTDFFLSIKNENEDNGGLVPVEHPNGIHELSISLASDREYELASNGITIKQPRRKTATTDDEILNEIISSIQSDEKYSSFPFVIEATAANDAIRLIYKKDAPSVSDATLSYDGKTVEATKVESELIFGSHIKT